MSGIFAGLSRSDLSTSSLDPKRLFRALAKPDGSKFKFPHDIQTEVWDRWFLRRDEPDLIIKMNTGSGKTVIGLLILKSSLNEGKGPAVYLVPDKQLLAQVGATAEQLGIAWTDDIRDSPFRQGEAVLVTTVHTMYNGLSRFGVRGAGAKRPLEVGSIVIDDAHACIPIIERQFSLVVDRSSPAYNRLFVQFKDALKGQSLAGFTGLVDNSGTQAVPLPYWDWQNGLETSFNILNSIAEGDTQKFVWPLVRDQLKVCDVAFTPSRIEIRIPYPDLSVVPSFVNASRRIYMTATLADDSLLITQMGVAASCVTGPITPSSASDIGDRIILTPTETSRRVSNDDVKASAAKWAKNHNVVVIVPSGPRAKFWNDVTNEIHDKDTIEDCVDRLNSGNHVGLVVLIARYDGVDLPNAACRVLILDGLPERYSPQELVEAVAIGGTDAMNVRQTQRIEQGMGRGVRSTDDYCAVILLDPRLVERLYNASDREQLSPATKAQYELSMQFSAGGRREAMSFFDEAVQAFLERDPSWTNASKQALEEVVYSTAESVPAIVTAERNAFEFALAGRFDEARQALSSATNGVTEARVRGWLKQRAAAYFHVTSPASARELQRSARIDNNYILKIPNEMAITRIAALSDQAAASSAYLNRHFATSRLLEVAIDALLLDLTPSTEVGSHKRFEAAFDLVGSILGFGASRPDQETGIGPDNLWAIGNDRFWAIECKSEATADEVSREYLEQLSHSTDWFDAGYREPRFTCVPLMIHSSRTPMWDAVPRQGARIMTFERLATLRQAISDFTAAIRVGDAYKTPASVGANLNEFGLKSSSMEDRWTQNFTKPALRK